LRTMGQDNYCLGKSCSESWVLSLWNRRTRHRQVLEVGPSSTHPVTISNAASKMDTSLSELRGSPRMDADSGGVGNSEEYDDDLDDCGLLPLSEIGHGGRDPSMFRRACRLQFRGLMGS
jgi:hypothetical protein